MKRIRENQIEWYHEISHERLKKTKMRNKVHKSKKDLKRNKRVKDIEFDDE